MHTPEVTSRDGGAGGTGQGCEDLVEEQIKQAGETCHQCLVSGAKCPAGAGPRNARVSLTPCEPERGASWFSVALATWVLRFREC